jgi:hypothetical protein
MNVIPPVLYEYLGDHSPSLNLFKRQVRHSFPFISKFNKLGNVDIDKKNFGAFAPICFIPGKM